MTAKKQPKAPAKVSGPKTHSGKGRRFTRWTPEEQAAVVERATHLYRFRKKTVYRLSSLLAAAQAVLPEDRWKSLASITQMGVDGHAQKMIRGTKLAALRPDWAEPRKAKQAPQPAAPAPAPKPVKAKPKREPKPSKREAARAAKLAELADLTAKPLVEESMADTWAAIEAAAQKAHEEQRLLNERIDLAVQAALDRAMPRFLAAVKGAINDLLGGAPSADPMSPPMQPTSPPLQPELTPSRPRRRIDVIGLRSGQIPIATKALQDTCLDQLVKVRFLTRDEMNTATNIAPDVVFAYDTLAHKNGDKVKKANGRLHMVRSTVPSVLAEISKLVNGGTEPRTTH